MTLSHSCAEQRALQAGRLTNNDSHAELFCFMHAPVALDDNAALLPFKKRFHLNASRPFKINFNCPTPPRSIQRPMLDERLEITLLFRQPRRVGTDDHYRIDRPHKLRGQLRCCRDERRQARRISRLPES